MPAHPHDGQIPTKALSRTKAAADSARRRSPPHPDDARKSAGGCGGQTPRATGGLNPAVRLSEHRLNISDLEGKRSAPVRGPDSRTSVLHMTPMAVSAPRCSRI